LSLFSSHTRCLCQRKRGPRHPPGASTVYLMLKTAQGQDTLPIFWAALQ